MKLDLGSGNNVKSGFEGVDIIRYDSVAHVIDVTKEWPWEENTVDEISSTGFLEHLSFADACALLSKCFKSLKKGSKIEIEVPDLEWSCEFFLKHTGSRYKDYTNDDRGIVFIYGMQNNPHEFHKFGYTQEFLELMLKSVGFKHVTVKKQFSHAQGMLLGEGWKL